MNVISLFSILYVTTPFLCGLEAGWKTGIGGILIGLFVGLFIGIGSVFGFRMFLTWMVRWEARHTKLSRLVTFPFGLWIFVSGLLAIYITQFVIHHVAV